MINLEILSKLNKKIYCAIFTCLWIVGISNIIFSSGWEQDEYGWKYENDDGTYQNKGWFRDEDGKFYYFNAFGYILTNTVTPDGGTVGSDGAWVLDPTLAAFLTEEEDRPNYKVVITKFSSLISDVDIPAGDYMVFVHDEESGTGKGTYQLSNKNNINDLLPYRDESFQYNSIVRLKNTEIISAVNCEFIPISMAQKLNYKKARFIWGGFNLPPGQYMVKADEKRGGIKYLSQPRDNNYSTKSSNPAFISEFAFNNYAIINIKAGEYVKLYHCHLIK